MGSEYRIVPPPDYAAQRRRVALLAALGGVVLLAALALSAPWLLRTARQALAGPGKGPVLVKRADGKLELKVPPAQVLIGQPRKWRKLASLEDGQDYQLLCGDFDGDKEQELLVWPESGMAELYESVGKSSKPGLCGWRLLFGVTVFDWNGDGIEDLIVPLDSNFGKQYRGKRSDGHSLDFQLGIVVDIHGSVFQKSLTKLMYTSPVKGSFTQAGACEYIVPAGSIERDYSSMFSDGKVIFPEFLHQLAVLGPHGSRKGKIDVGISPFECLAVRLDADPLDEAVVSSMNGEVRQVKSGTDPSLLKNWPEPYGPVAAGELDGSPCDELVAITQNPTTSIWSARWIKTGKVPTDEEAVSAKQRADDLDQQQADLISSRLEKSGAELLDDGMTKPADLSSDAAIQAASTRFDQYFDQFVRPDGMEKLWINRILAWEYYRPVGFIYFSNSHSSTPIAFPKALKWSNCWDTAQLDGPTSAICRHPGAKLGVIYTVPDIGTSVLAFDGRGRCTYYEEFGKGASFVGKLETQAGDYLVLRVGNDLLAYP